MSSRTDINPAREQRSREPWRWRCPNGHTSWIRAGDRYYCRTCTKDNGESGVHFGDLVDAKEVDK